MAVDSPVTIEQVKEYQQIRTPDMAALATYVNYAKGPDRTMAQFAEDTQIGASTLSRIVNRNIKKPLSIDVIIAIYEHRADPADEYLLDALARANGLFPQEYAVRVQRNDRYVGKRNEEISRERMMKNALIAGVAACGLGIKQVVNTPILCRNAEVPTMYPRRRGDFILDLNTESNISGIKSWTFFLYPQIIDEADRERHRTVKGEVRSIIERLATWFLLDSWDTENLKGSKFSFAFVDEQLFIEFKDALQLAKLHTEMTVILLDPTDFSVINEAWLPGEYEQLSQISVFEVPAPGANDDFYDDDED